MTDIEIKAIYSLQCSVLTITQSLVSDVCLVWRKFGKLMSLERFLLPNFK